MKKNVFGRKLKRDKNERTALFKSLMSSFILNEKIETTTAKAKAIRPEIEKLVTKAKKADNASKRVLEQSLSRPAFDKMVNEIGPRFSKRQGGYVRLIKLGRRFGDDAPVVIMEWVDKAVVLVVPEVKKEKKTKEVKPEKKAVKKEEKKTVKKPVKKETKPKVKKSK